MEDQAIMNLPIGTKELEKKMLEPEKVEIVKIGIENIEKAKAHKAIFEVKHPKSNETIKISAVSYLDGKSIKTSGTWINQDSEGNLQKGTALTNLLAKVGANTLNEAIGKSVETESGDSGYLVFKAY